MADEYGNLNDNAEKLQSMWILLGITIDRISFIIYFVFTVYAVVLNYE